MLNLALVIFCLSLVCCVLSSTPSCRDRTLWPFSSTSRITSCSCVNAISCSVASIGVQCAQFVHGGIYQSPYGPPDSFHNDQDFFVVTTKNDPVVAWVDQGSWGPGNKCEITGEIADHINIPVPIDFTTGCVMNNNAAGFLMPDNRTLVQMQPLYRSAPGEPILALYHKGGPIPFPWEIDILGDGALGAHGGSGLSAVGGTIRLGELLPDTPPITHALKLEFYAHQYYHYGSPSTCYTWPAVGCDGYAATVYNGSNPYIKPGALLAIPSYVSSSLSLATIPGKKIMQALTTYGGYIVDDTADNTGAICMEAGVTAELEKAYNCSVDISNPISPSQGRDFYSDLVTIFQALYVVVNNNNSTVGGGGTPIGPIAPPIC